MVHERLESSLVWCGNLQIELYTKDKRKAQSNITIQEKNYDIIGQCKIEWSDYHQAIQR